MYIGDLKTGDLLLFDERPTNCCLNLLDSCIKCCTRSSYSHAAIVIRDPCWMDEKGLFVWESSYHGTPDPQDDIVKFGVQLTPLSLYTDGSQETTKLYVRRCRSGASRLFTDKKLRLIHETAYKKVYDINPMDWLEAWTSIPLHRRTTKRFFCSAFVAFAFTRLGILDKDSNWTMVSPADLSSRRSNSVVKWNIPFSDDCRVVF